MLSTLFSLDPTQPGCPWYDLHQASPPNVLWCEDRVCSIFMTPFNTLTNLGYVFVGLYLMYKLRNSPSRTLRSFGPGAIIVGLSSGIYHASLNFYTQIFDFFGMYIYCMLLIMFNLARLKKWPAPPRAFRRFWLWVFGLTALTTISLAVSIKFPIQIYVLVLIISIMRTELVQTAGHRKYFWLTALCMIVAATVSALDVTHVLCFPDNHWFQGHGLWHMLTALALFFSYKHYEQFEKHIP